MLVLTYLMFCLFYNFVDSAAFYKRLRAYDPVACAVHVDEFRKFPDEAGYDAAKDDQFYLKLFEDMQYMQRYDALCAVRKRKYEEKRKKTNSKELREFAFILHSFIFTFILHSFFLD